jgi:uncharacterized protein DUF5681
LILIRFRLARVRAKDATGDTTRDRVRDAPRDSNGRFAKGHSGNPKGRPRHPQPAPPPARAAVSEARPGTLVPLVGRKRYLLRPVLSLVLPPTRRPDPGERLGIDFARMRSAPCYAWFPYRKRGGTKVSRQKHGPALRTCA